MPIRFACPSCAATGSVSASAVGKSATCKHCGHRFTIPGPDPAAAEPGGIPLEAAAAETAGAGYALMEPVQVSTFAPTRGDEPATGAPRRPKRSAAGSTTRTSAKRATRSAWPARLSWAAGTLAIILAAIALLVPKGLLIAACAVIAVGCVLILAGYAVGAYGAFSEDFVYGFLYLVIPLYTAYYMVTRWDDLWVWFACMTSGVGLVLLGVEMARWGGVVA